MEDGKLVKNNASTSYDVTAKSITPLVRPGGGDCQAHHTAGEGWSGVRLAKGAGIHAGACCSPSWMLPAPGAQDLCPTAGRCPPRHTGQKTLTAGQ